MLSDNQYFPNVVASEEELQGRIVMKEVFDVAVIEDALQPKLRTMLKAERVEALNVVAIVRRIWSGVLRMEEGQKIAFRVEHGGNAFDHWLHQRLGEVIGNVPAQHCVELDVSKDEIFLEESIHVDSARLRAAAVFSILRKEKNVFVIDAMAEFCEMGDVGRRSWTEVQDRKPLDAFEQTSELS